MEQEVTSEIQRNQNYAGSRQGKVKTAAPLTIHIYIPVVRTVKQC